MTGRTPRNLHRFLSTSFTSEGKYDNSLPGASVYHRSSSSRSPRSKFAPSPVIVKSSSSSMKNSSPSGGRDVKGTLTEVASMYNKKFDSKDVAKLALFSRMIVFGLQVLSAELIPLHDNDGFKFRSQEERKLMDPVIDFLLKGFTSWDGQYFLHIATHGYTEENTMAFFPLFPMSVTVVTKILHYVLFPIITFSSLAVLVGFVINLSCFIKSAQVIHRIVPYLDRGRENLGGMVVILYCFNPASIFFTSFYSESLFAFLTFSMLLALFERDYKIALIYATLSSLCRSNGLLNFGFFFMFSLRDALVDHKRSNYEEYFGLAKSAVATVIACVVGMMPFLGFQVFCYRRFCDVEYVYPEKVPHFCIDSAAQLPYQYIQSHNWNVGFLRYFELKQLPNFFLAAPVLITLAQHCYPRLLKYIKSVMQDLNYACIPSLSIAAHGAFLTAFCFTSMHVQVSTRLIFSSCPYLIIFIAKSLRSEIFEFRTGRRSLLPVSLFIYGWFLLYVIVGSLAFSAGYPWT